jgi:hypothetical protein
MPNSALRICAAIFLVLSIVNGSAARRDPEDATDSTAAAAAAAAAKAGAVPASAAFLELTNATLAAQLAAVASPEKVIIFTTTSAFLAPLLNMTRNWFMHVHKCVSAGLPPWLCVRATLMLICWF